MNNQTIVCCVVALVLGMLLFHMLKGVCGCKLTEGQPREWDMADPTREERESETWQRLQLTNHQLNALGR